MENCDINSLHKLIPSFSDLKINQEFSRKEQTAITNMEHCKYNSHNKGKEHSADNNLKNMLAWMPFQQKIINFCKEIKILERIYIKYYIILNIYYIKYYINNNNILFY